MAAQDTVFCFLLGYVICCLGTFMFGNCWPCVPHLPPNQDGMQGIIH